MPDPHMRSRPHCRCWWRDDRLEEARQTYVRTRDLSHLIGLWSAEIEAPSLAGQKRLLRLLRQALRAERQRGLAGHWTYDLARHASLLKAYRCELSCYGFRPGGPCGSDPLTDAICRCPSSSLCAGGRPAGSDPNCAATSRVAYPAPSSWPARIAPPHNSARPWDSREGGPTSRDTLLATDCSASSDAASAT